MGRRLDLACKKKKQKKRKEKEFSGNNLQTVAYHIPNNRIEQTTLLHFITVYSSLSVGSLCVHTRRFYGCAFDSLPVNSLHAICFLQFNPPNLGVVFCSTKLSSRLLDRF